MESDIGRYIINSASRFIVLITLIIMILYGGTIADKLAQRVDSIMNVDITEANETTISEETLNSTNNIKPDDSGIKAFGKLMSIIVTIVTMFMCINIAMVTVIDIMYIKFPVFRELIRVFGNRFVSDNARMAIGETENLTEYLETRMGINRRGINDEASEQKNNRESTSNKQGVQNSKAENTEDYRYTHVSDIESINNNEKGRNIITINDEENTEKLTDNNETSLRSISIIKDGEKVRGIREINRQ